MALVQDRVGWRRRAQDVALAVFACLLDLVVFSQVLGPDDFPGWVVGYAVAGFSALLWRRRAPLVVFGVLWLHCVVASVAIPSYAPLVGLLIALFTVANRARHAAGLWALAAMLLPIGFQVSAEVTNAPAQSGTPTLAASLVALSLISCGAWSLGRWARTHREQLDLLDEQRRRDARDAVVRERTRIARDLHDVISHSVGVMTLQAAGARRVLEGGNHGRALQALADIESVGTEAMTELRRLLSVLRVADATGSPSAGPGPAEPDAEASRPRPGLHDVATLVDGVLTVGIPARLVTHGEPGELDAGVDLSAYRIVQESLTNVAKHAGPGTPTTVELRWGHDTLHLTITNTAPHRHGATARPLPGGYGLLGLHERAAAVGGTLDARPQADGGFRVTAALPVDRADRLGTEHDRSGGPA